MHDLDLALFKRLSAFKAPETGSRRASRAHVATVLANLASLGANPNEGLVHAIEAASSRGLRDFYRTAQDVLHGAISGYSARRMRPLYPNFPQEYMSQQEAGLFLSALPAKLKAKEPLVTPQSFIPVRTVGLLPKDAEEKLFRQLLAQPAAFSNDDLALVKLLLTELPNATEILTQVETIPNKENLAHLYRISDDRVTIAARFDTATDVLRAAVAVAGGDASLAGRAVRLGNLTRSSRRELLGALERIGNVLEDMGRHPGWWKRVGEKLHPGEYAGRFPNTADAFRRLRAGDLPQSFEGRVDTALDGPIEDLLKLLTQRPGVFTRRLDSLLRRRPVDAAKILDAYGSVGAQVSTPVLLQAHAHFLNRNKDRGSRVYFPKGSTARPWVSEEDRPALEPKVTDAARERLSASMVEKFSELEDLGKVWIDPAIDGMKVPLQVRDASSSLRTVGRGSRVKLPDLSVIRGFMWWLDKPNGRVDLDLSAAAYTENLEQVAAVTFYMLSDAATGMKHSGDFTSAPAPDGAAEFVDIPVGAAKSAGARYVILTVHSYSGQLFAELDGAFAGVQALTDPSRYRQGEPFNMAEVVDKFDLTSDASVFTPIAFDLVTNEAIWLDLPSSPRIDARNLHNTSKIINAPLEAMLDSDAPSLKDLFEAHVAARGTLVQDREDADFVIAEDGDLSPFNVAEVLTDWAS